jgi:hypothetical protein
MSTSDEWDTSVLRASPARLSSLLLGHLSIIVITLYYTATHCYNVTILDHMSGIVQNKNTTHCIFGTKLAIHPLLKCVNYEFNSIQIRLAVGAVGYSFMA